MSGARRTLQSALEETDVILREFEDYVSSLVDLTKPENLRWLYRVHPDLVMRRFMHLVTTPLYDAIHNGPLALIRYVVQVARTAFVT